VDDRPTAGGSAQCPAADSCADETPGPGESTWGYRRIQGALTNLGHRVARSTIATILRAEGIGPVPERPTSWRTFLTAHWGAIAAADFFTTEAWTARGLVTYYTLFVIDLGSRKVQIVGSTPHPDEAFVLQRARAATHADDGCLRNARFLICDRDTKWSLAVRQALAAAGIRLVQTPYAAPNCNAYAERFVRSVKEGCLNRLVMLGEAHLRRTRVAFTEHSHRERNHQGLQDRLIMPMPAEPPHSPIRCRARLGGLLRYYYRAA
jgi:putative transposase